MDKLQLYKAEKSFGAKKVVREVSFELETGEILGLFGRNGSGKSTLLQLLFGTVKADRLSLAINNTRILPSEVIPNQYIGYLPQHPFLPQNGKVRDLIPVYHTSQEAQDAVFYDPHIATMSAKRVGTLSLGELKYLEVVMLGNLKHPFLMLDEPFSMLEPLHKEQLKAYLTNLKKKKGILITDHYYRDVLDISSTYKVLVDGVLHTARSEADLQKFEYLSE